MYEHIYVPVDNSEHSSHAVQKAIALGRSCGAKLTGCHVYAARMHDYRFKQMEFTLPEEYLEEAELERQRKIHDSLITMGLELVSDCYLTDLEQLCQAAGLDFRKKMMDGKHSTEIVKDVGASDYDLVVLGVQGIGRTRDSQVGSVCARVTQAVDRDVWVVKHLPQKDEAERDTIVVGVDGSPSSFGALATGIELARRFGKKLELLAVYDPYLHYAVFKGIVEVLTERAAKVFRFEEQNQLHEEVIDTGLAEIYQSHLNVAEEMARREGVAAEKTLLDGKAFQKVIDHVRRVEPWLLIVGRLGVHSEEGESGLGSNADNLLRLCPCDVLLSTRRVTPELDLKAEESIHWTAEAESRMTRVPEQVKGIARTAILRLAIEKGHSVVTSDLVTEAMDRFMPKSAARRTEKLAEALAFERARQGQVSICRRCGVSAAEPEPARCTVCGATDFEVVTPEMVEAIVAAEGGSEEEVTYDGRKLRWTQESRQALRTLTDPYQRRRAKARIEKSARGRKMEVVTLELARRFIEEEGGVVYKAVAEERTGGAAPAAEAAASPPAAAPEDGAAAGGVRIVVRDKNDSPLLSRYPWEEDAIERLLRVPAGFMRDKTQGRVEELAAERGAHRITLELVEGGIEIGRRMMAEMIQQYGGASPEMRSVDAAAAPAATPAAAPSCPVEEGPENGARASANGGGDKLPLNEVGVMSELERRRRQLAGEDQT